MIRIVAVGKKHETWLEEGIKRYEKRLVAPFLCEWVLVSPSAQKGARAALEESERINHKLRVGTFVILLDERGREVDSPTLSRLLTQPLERSQEVVIVIGGAYGVTDQIRQRADMLWSLSPLVFPHQLVRLLLIEQLYRAQTIRNGLPYHNN